QRRNPREQLLLHGLAGHEKVDRLDARAARRVDEVLALGGEEAGLLAMLALGEHLADELQRLVVAGGDHSRQSMPLPCGSTRAATRAGPAQTRSSSSKTASPPAVVSQRRTEAQARGRPSAAAASSSSPSSRATSSGR